MYNVVLYEKVIKNGIIILFVAILQNREFVFIGLLLTLNEVMDMYRS